VVVAAIWVAIIAPVIRPVVVGAVIPSGVPPIPPIIGIAVVTTISIATIPVAGISLIAVTTPLRHIAIYATLSICC